MNIEITQICTDMHKQAYGMYQLFIGALVRFV